MLRIQRRALQGYGPPRVFLTSKISYLRFPNLTHKTIAGIAYDKKTANSNPIRPIKPSSQSTFLTSKISYLLFPSLAHKTKAGTTYGRRLLIATQLDQTSHLANQHFSHPRLVIFTFSHPHP
jgi:hypothetical protein